MRRWLTLLVLGGLLVLVAPGVPGLSYVYSESMEPTISVGDGYVIVPAGDVEPGDIVTFESEQFDSYVTHRVVAVVDGGYLTQGDNNPSTDQAAGHPVVTDADIVGQVLTVGGHPVIIPYLAAITSAISTYWPLGLLLVLLGGGLVDRNPRARDVVRIRDLTLPLAATAVLGSVVVMAYGAPTYAMSFVAVVSDFTGGRVIPVGEAVTRTVEIGVNPPFTYQFVDGNGVAVVETVTRDGVRTTDVLVPARDGPGGYAASVTTYHYPTVLPYGVMSVLHGVHPAVASAASILTLVAPLAALHWLLVDGRAPLESRSRARNPWWEWR